MVSRHGCELDALVTSNLQRQGGIRCRILQVDVRQPLKQIADVVEQGRAAGFHAYAGHGLRTDNVGPIAAIPGMAELNIGHFIIARAAIVGMDAAVREMLAARAGKAE